MCRPWCRRRSIGCTVSSSHFLGRMQWLDKRRHQSYTAQRGNLVHINSGSWSRKNFCNGHVSLKFLASIRFLHLLCKSTCFHCHISSLGGCRGLLVFFHISSGALSLLSYESDLDCRPFGGCGGFLVFFKLSSVFFAAFRAARGGASGILSISSTLTAAFRPLSKFSQRLIIKSILFSIIIMRVRVSVINEAHRSENGQPFAC